MVESSSLHGSRPADLRGWSAKSSDEEVVWRPGFRPRRARRGVDGGLPSEPSVADLADTAVSCAGARPMPNRVAWRVGSVLVVHRLPHLVERSETARSRGPSGVVGDVDHHRLEGRAFEAEIACATEMEAKFGVSTGRDEYRACDQRAFLDRQAVAVPDITEEVAHRVADHLTREWPCAGGSGEQARGQCSAAIEQFVGCGRRWLCHQGTSVTSRSFVSFAGFRQALVSFCDGDREGQAADR